MYKIVYVNDVYLEVQRNDHFSPLSHTKYLKFA